MNPFRTARCFRHRRWRRRPNPPTNNRPLNRGFLDIKTSARPRTSPPSDLFGGPQSPRTPVAEYLVTPCRFPMPTQPRTRCNARNAPCPRAEGAIRCREPAARTSINPREEAVPPRSVTIETSRSSSPRASGFFAHELGRKNCFSSVTRPLSSVHKASGEARRRSRPTQRLVGPGAFGLESVSSRMLHCPSFRIGPSPESATKRQELPAFCAFRRGLRP